MVRKYVDRYVTSIPFERQWYDGINKLLPRGVSISDEINEFLKQRVLELKNEMNLSAIDKAPVKIYENFNSKITTMMKEKQHQETFDIYGSQKDLITHVNNITDASIAWKLKRNAKLLNDLANTRAKELEGIHRLR